MTSKSEPKAFELRVDLTDVEEESYDAILGNPEDRSLLLEAIPLDATDLPNEVWFWASLNRVKDLDLVHNDVGWKICSRRLLEALEAIGPFPHRAIPVHFKEAREGLTGTLEDQFVVLVITEATDAVDMERSKVEYDEDGSVLFVKKWHFRAPRGGLPPVFKVELHSGLFLLSETAAQALKKRKFKGVTITPQEKIGHL
jgi:hypothetical protein